MNVYLVAQLIVQLNVYLIVHFNVYLIVHLNVYLIAQMNVHLNLHLNGHDDAKARSNTRRNTPQYVARFLTTLAFHNRQNSFVDNFYTILWFQGKCLLHKIETMS